MQRSKCPANKWYYQGKCQKMRTHKHHVAVKTEGFPEMSYEVHPIKYKHYDTYSLERHEIETGQRTRWMRANRGITSKYGSNEDQYAFRRTIEKKFEDGQKQIYPTSRSHKIGAKVDWNPIVKRMERDD